MRKKGVIRSMREWKGHGGNATQKDASTHTDIQRTLAALSLPPLTSLASPRSSS